MIKIESFNKSKKATNPLGILFEPSKASSPKAIAPNAIRG